MDRLYRPVYNDASSEQCRDIFGRGTRERGRRHGELGADGIREGTWRSYGFDEPLDLAVRCQAGVARLLLYNDAEACSASPDDAFGRD